MLACARGKEGGLEVTVAQPPYVDLLSSPSAQDRLRGLEVWNQLHGANAEIVPMLADDAPVLHSHAGRRVITEVRAAVLVALQDRYRMVGTRWDLGPVQVRKAMSAEEAEQRADKALGGLDEAERRAVLERAEQALQRHIQPREEDRSAVRAYRVLQELGQVDYLQQEVGKNWLTPLQAEVHASQTRTDRPRPHVRFDGDSGPVGWVYRAERGWALDFDESPLGREIREYVDRWLHVARGGVPRVVYEGGAPKTSPDGAFVLDGVVPNDTTDLLDWLRSVAAFGAREHRATLVP
jgi:hypothetical protein